MKQSMMTRFFDAFGGHEPPRVFFAGGRVNLIGEHTDYNGGHVFPCALTMGTYGAIRLRADDVIRLYSDNFPDAGIIKAPLSPLTFEKTRGWANYVLGVVWALCEAGMRLPCGFDLMLHGDLPNGAGLSSSASVEVLTGYALKQTYGLDVDLVALARIGQRAENAFVGLNCGIMDQFASAMGRENAAIFLDTATLAYRYAPLVLDRYELLIFDSKKVRGLADSKYNERRAECDHALACMRSVRDVPSLGALTEAEFLALQHAIPSETERRRARHAVTENVRTVEAAQQLENGNLAAFGRLMNESHRSLREDYAVSCRELDVLVDALQRAPTVLGARMTGAGFGGCVIALADKNDSDALIARVLAEYRENIGHAAACYRAGIGGGPREL